MNKPEPAMKYGLIVGLIAMITSGILGIQISEDERLQLDNIVGLAVLLFPLVQGLVQGWLTRRKVVPIKTLEKAGVSADSVNARAGHV